MKMLVLSKDTLNVFDVMGFSDDVPLKNVAACMAGYLLGKVKLECPICIEKFIISKIPEEDEIYTLLREKASKEQGTLH